MKFLSAALLSLVLLLSNAAYAEDTIATTSSLEGYDTLLSIELKSGDLSLYETPRGSNFAVSIDMKGAPLCRTEVVADPVRVLLDCPGRILQGLKPIKLVNSKMAKQVRFGYSGDNSKIVIDMNIDVFAVQSQKEKGDRSLFVFGGKGKAFATPDPSQTVTPSPTSTIPVKTGSSASSVGPVFTPVPLPKIEFGETDLLSLVFAKATPTKSSVIKISLRAGRNVELKRQSSTKYLLRIAAARVFSPIFLQPQMAPEGCVPFRQAQISEVVPASGPVDLSVQIDLTSGAELQVKQSGGDIEIYTGQSEELEE